MSAETWADLPPIMTVKEVAAWLRVSESHVYELAARDEIPHKRVGRKILFDREELLKWWKG